MLDSFLIPKNSIFQNKKVENFKNLEILRSKGDLFNFLQKTNFDTFMLENLNFLHMFYILGILQENKESNSHRLIQKPYVLHQSWNKMKIL